MRRLAGGRVFSRSAVALTLAAALMTTASVVRAEGSAQTGDNQSLDPSTDIFVRVDKGEVINVAARYFTMSPYPGQASNTPVHVTITTPSGEQSIVTLSSGAGLLDASVDTTPHAIDDPYRYTAQETGVYKIEFDHSVLPYDITVTPDSSTPVYPHAPYGTRGRIYSKNWRFNAGTFAQSGATNANYYVVTPAGGDDSNYVWLLDFEGMAGYVYNVAGNSLGLSGSYARTSQKGSTGATFTPEYDVYLNLPITAKGPKNSPSISFEGVAGKGMTIRGAGGTFRFHSNVAGTYQIVIDTNLDGSFDTSTSDARISGTTVVGNNDAVWDGKDANGQVVSESDTPYQVKLFLRLGEFHFAGWDIETADPGLAIFAVDPNTGNLTDTLMYWDDRPVLTGDSEDDPSPATTLPDGVLSSSTRHRWGSFWSGGPGNVAYVDTWVFGSESSDQTSIMIHSPTADADGDGVDNEDDEYPCDASKSSSIFIPGENQMGMLLYEDRWPDAGDLDFNDLVLAYNYEIVLDAQGQVKAFIASYVPRALGAGLHNGLALELPVPISSISSAKRAVDMGTPSDVTLRQDGDKTVIVVSDDVRELFGNAQGYINTEPTAAVIPASSVRVRIEFSTPPTIDTSEAPFDVFLFRGPNGSHQIHRCMYQGTSWMDTSLFGTGSDNSSQGRWFVDSRGIPFVLDVPLSTNYALEKHRVDQLFPDIVAFAASGGSTHSDYYQTNVQTSHAFLHGLSNMPPVTATVPPRMTVVTGSCGQ